MTEACDDCRRLDGSITRIDGLVLRGANHAMRSGRTAPWAQASAAYERALARLDAHRATHHQDAA